MAAARRQVTRAARNAAWIEAYCHVPEGRDVGKRVRLTAHQRRWLAKIYDSPTRLFILSMARKNAKTAFCSFLLLLHLCGPEATPNSQLYSAAQSREQAALLFKYAAKVVRMSSELSAVISIRDAVKELSCPELGTLYRALSAEASTAFGLSPAFVVHDELGQVRGPRSELYDALETAGAAHAEPLSIVISTQAPNETDLLSRLIDDAQTGADPRRKLELHAAPLEIDPFSTKALRAANPHFDAFMNRDELRAMAKNAKRSPADEASFRNYILNQRVEARAPFVTRSVWQGNGAAPAELEGRRVWGGLDLSSVSDLTALVLVDEDGGVHPTFWLPGDGLAEKARRDRTPYDTWHRQGLLLTTPGMAIEYEFIAEHLRGIFDRCDVQAIAFDRWNMKNLRPWLARAGFSEPELERFVEFGQGFASMSPAIRELEAQLLERRLAHGQHPVLTMCSTNAEVISDPAGNRKFRKPAQGLRIDGMVALAMAVASRSQQQVDSGDLDGFLDNPIVVA